MPKSSSSAKANETDVFINCPFDDAYQSLFDATIYSVIACGYKARCALEINDAGTTRIDKIRKIISECRLGVHDISRTELSPPYHLPRFNMPLELGLFLGAKFFGNARQKSKTCLVLDKEKFRYQQFMSDISGQDVFSHENNPHRLIARVRDWLNDDGLWNLPGGKRLCDEFDRFISERQKICDRVSLTESQLTFRDRVVLIEQWLTESPPSVRSP